VRDHGSPRFSYRPGVAISLQLQPILFNGPEVCALAELLEEHEGALEYGNLPGVMIVNTPFFAVVLGYALQLCGQLST